MARSPYFGGGGVGDAVVDPPSFVPQINNLGQVIDNIANRRLQIAREERAQAHQESTDRFYQGKLEEQQRRNTIKERGEWAKHNLAQSKAFALNPSASTMLFYDTEGNLVPVQPRFIRGQAAPAPATAPASPEAGGVSLPAVGDAAPKLREPFSPAARPSAFGMQLRPPAGGAPSGPQAQVTQVPPARVRGERFDMSRDGREMFVDQINEDTARVLYGDDPNLVDVPAASLPPGAREGQRFVAGRLRPPIQMPNVQRQPMPDRLDLVNPKPDTYFYDENNDGTVQALPGPDESRIVNMPEDAFPPGAREGQRFAAEDVGENGRKGNPFAGPLPMGPESNVFVDQVNEGAQGDMARVLIGDDPRLQDVPTSRLPVGAREGQTFRGEDVGVGAGRVNPAGQPIPQLETASPQRQNMPQTLDLGSPQAQVTQVPPAVARGDVHRVSSDPQGDHWVLDTPHGRIIVDQEMQRQARTAEAQARLRQVEDAMATAIDPRAQLYLANQAAGLRAQLGDKATAQMAQFGQQTAEREAAQASRAEEAQKQREFTGEQNEANRTNAKEIAAMRRRQAGRLGRGVTDTTGAGSAWQRLDPKDQRAFRTNYRIEENNWARRVNWDKLEGVGIDRLNLADVNISSEGPYANTQWVESMMNFFGYIRGGVPAENETKEWRRSTTTLSNTVNSIGQYFKIPGLWDRLSGNDTEEARKAWGEVNSRMTPQQRKELTQAIRESRSVVKSTGDKNIDVLAERFEEEAVPYREYVTAKANSFRSFLGLPQKQFYSDVPLKERKLMRAGRAQSSASASPPTPGANRPPTATSTPGKKSLDDLILSLP